jgi:hypothetical protein
MNKIEKYLNYVIFAFTFLVLFRTCNISNDIKKMRQDVEKVSKQVNKLDSTSIKKPEMVRIIKETPNWKTLEIEELSDKNKVPVNYYKNMDK